MSLLPAFSALTFFSSAFLGAFALAGRRDGLFDVARILGALAGLALVPSLAEPGSRALSIFALAIAAFVPRPEPQLLASVAATLVALRGPRVGEGPVSTVIAALAAAGAAASASKAARSDWGRRPAWAAVCGGIAVTLAAGAQDGGRVLRWGFAIGKGATRSELPGAAVLLGLTLLVSLGGAVILAAHLLSSTVESASLARLIGQRALIVAAGLGVLSSAFVVAWGLSLRPEALVAGAPGVAALLGTTGLLVLSIVFLLGEPWGSLSEERGRGALCLAILALASAGFEGWFREGTVLGPRVQEALAAALLGVSAYQTTRGALFRRTLFLLALLFLLV
jgi:hypothetical protein